MHPDDILGYIVVTVVVIIPALALTARLIIAPMFLSKSRQAPALDPGLNDRLTALEAEVGELKEENAVVRQEVQALRSAEAFYRQLQLPPQSAERQ